MSAAFGLCFNFMAILTAACRRNSDTCGRFDLFQHSEAPVQNCCSWRLREVQFGLVTTPQFSRILPVIFRNFPAIFRNFPANFRNWIGPSLTAIAPLPPPAPSRVGSAPPRALPRTGLNLKTGKGPGTFDQNPYAGAQMISAPAERVPQQQPIGRMKTNMPKKDTFGAYPAHMADPYQVHHGACSACPYCRDGPLAGGKPRVPGSIIRGGVQGQSTLCGKCHVSNWPGNCLHKIQRLREIGTWESAPPSLQSHPHHNISGSVRTVYFRKSRGFRETSRGEIYHREFDLPQKSVLYVVLYIYRFYHANYLLNNC